MKRKRKRKGQELLEDEGTCTYEKAEKDEEEEEEEKRERSGIFGQSVAP